MEAKPPVMPDSYLVEVLTTSGWQGIFGMCVDVSLEYFDGPKFHESLQQWDNWGAEIEAQRRAALLSCGYTRLAEERYGMTNKIRKPSKAVVDELGAFEMTDRMLRVATDLRRAAAILDQAHADKAEGGNNQDLSAAFRGSPILEAQSAEIALKALWRIGHNMGCGDSSPGEPPRSHSLSKLHDALTEPIQKLLEKEFPEIPNPICPNFPFPYRKGLRTILCEHEDALVQWRYTYEHHSLNFEHVFQEVLTVLIKVGWRLQKHWLQRLRDGA